MPKKVAGKTGAKPEGDDKSDKKKSRAFKDLKKMNEGRKDEEGKEPLKRKEIKVQRKMHENPNYHTEMHIKKLWEKLRNAETTEAKEAFVVKIFEAVKTGEKNMTEFAFAHDTTRVLQSCLQHGSADQRRVLFEQLKLKVPEMAASKYARNVVLKLIKYGERDIKDYCIENMGNIRKLVRSNIGQNVLEYAYNQFAQSKQRLNIISKLYGKTWTKLSKMETEPTLISVVEKNADFCETILTDFMEDLKALTEKEIMQQTISHKAFLDFFNLCLFMLHSENPKLVEKRKRISEIRCELIEELKASVIHMIHTPDGAKAGLHCIWFGTAKDRKLMLKTVKEFLVKVITSESGYLLSLGIIDSVDDTVLVKKMLISPLCKELDELMENKVARKTIWYILNARDPRAFLPDVTKLLEVGDQSQTYKKPRTVKYGEIKATAIPHILEWFSENIAKCILEPGLQPMLVAALSHSDSNQIMKDQENMLNTVHSAFAKKLNTDYSSDLHPLKQKGVAMSIKQILSMDRERTELKFSKVLAEICQSQLESWLGDNRGCFLLLQLLEVNDPETIELVKSAIGSNLVENREEIVKTKGGQLLLEKAIDSNGNFKMEYELNVKKVYAKPTAELKKEIENMETE